MWCDNNVSIIHFLRIGMERFRELRSGKIKKTGSLVHVLFFAMLTTIATAVNEHFDPVMPHSVKRRLFVSLLSNTLRSGMSFLTGLIIARGLTPNGYGELTFLIGSFVAIRSLLDLGTSNAFYTFISQERRPVRYYSYYGLWLMFQFSLTAAVVAFILPPSMLHKIWLGHSRPVILLAFAASFFQQQLWQTVNQIGEAARKTVKVQYLNVSLAAVYLCSAFLLTAMGVISVRAVLILLILQYIAAALVSIWVLGPFAPVPDPASGPITPGRMFEKYREYCVPLVTLSLVGFAYDFSDKWMLQRFGGANQQGFYQVAYLLASISILATTSTLNIFWKETAEATKLKDTERVHRIFRKVSRGLFMFGAVLSGFLIPWSAQIISVFLGKAYSPAGAVLTLMLLYPVHQSLGQIAGTMLLAGERTKQYLTVSAIFMLISLPISYLLQAPAEGMLVPGLNLGAVGMAVKMVGLNVISVNVLLWVIARNYGWKFDFLYQVVGLGAMLLGGYLAKLAMAGVFTGMNTADKLHLLPPFLISGCLYLTFAAAVVWRMPWLIGMERDEVRGYAAKLRSSILPASR